MFMGIAAHASYDLTVMRVATSVAKTPYYILEMIIQFNFENNTQILSVKVCIHFFWWTLYMALVA
jgi:ABC-type dipeptide/oligopeptide/nickel transport system permease subunit